nr:uncharacterized protein LOC127315563 [Lolium perenne]
MGVKSAELPLPKNKRFPFGRLIHVLQTDNGKEFDNVAVRTLLSSHGTIFRLTCPYTSQQNGRAERILRTLNDCVRTLLFHSHAQVTSSQSPEETPPRHRAPALAAPTPPAPPLSSSSGAAPPPTLVSPSSPSSGATTPSPPAAPLSPSLGTATSTPPTSPSSSDSGVASLTTSPSSGHSGEAVPAATGLATRACAGVFCPSARYPPDTYVRPAAAAPSPPSASSPLPSSARAALRDPLWRAAMQDEFHVLQRNKMWQLVPRPRHANVITRNWVFKKKFHPMAHSTATRRVGLFVAFDSAPASTSPTPSPRL